MIRAMETLTTNMAAERLTVSRRRIIALIESGRLPAEKFGRDYVIKESDLALVAERKAGRPKKDGAAATNDSTGTKTGTLTKPMKKVVRKVQK
jgi:excisionase family DNA binding protein